MADWHRARIKAALEMKGTSLEALDRSLDLTAASCSTACRRPHEAGERAIAAALGLSPQVIWPSRYGADGHRLRPQPGISYRQARNMRHRQNAVAA